MSEEAQVPPTDIAVPSEPMSARSDDVQIEENDSEITAPVSNGVIPSETVKDGQSAADVKDTNGTSDTMPQEDNPAPQDTIKTSSGDVEAEDQTMTNAASAETVAVSGAVAPATPASAGKSKARRKSAGVPEHKGKKSTKKASKAANSHIDAKPGDYYYIKLKGYPLWPGIVCSEDMLPQTLTSSRPVTAARPDGTYREGYEDGGKKVHDRTFPVMYLHTQEFGWIPNFDLVDIDLDAIGEPEEKMRKDLAQAHRLAAEKHDLAHWKNVLLEFQQAREAELEAQAAKAAAKAAGKGKRKSKVGADGGDNVDEDVEMADVAAEEGSVSEKKPKASKKRKATTDAEESADTPQRTDSVKKLKLKVNSTPKTPNGNATPKAAKKDQSAAKSAKSKSKKATTNGTAEVVTSPQEPELTPEEKLAKKEKEIMFLRHKLQKGLLTKDQEPKEDEMAQMSIYITKLEEHANLEISIMKATKINKVLKAILKLESIPKEEEFKFKERSQALLGEWNKILGTDQPSAAAVTTVQADKLPEKELENGDAMTKTEDRNAESEPETQEKPVESAATSADVTVTEASAKEIASTGTATVEDQGEPSVSDTATVEIAS